MGRLKSALKKSRINIDVDSNVYDEFRRCVTKNHEGRWGHIGEVVETLMVAYITASRHRKT